MSVVTARCALLAAAIALSACSGGKPAGQFALDEAGASDAMIALSACSGGKPAGQFASDEAGASDAIHGSNAAHGNGGMTMPSTGDPDTDFLRGMIPHHEGAVEMARTEISQGTDPKVRAMAEEVIRTQQAEIVKMQTWLAERQAAKKGTQ